MNFFLKSVLLIIAVHTLSSCSYLNKKREEDLSVKEDFKLVKVNNEYGLLIPKYMKKSDNLNDDASLQYQNIFKETYVIVIDESKEEFIATFQDLGEYDDSLSVAKNYRNIQLQYLTEGISEPKESDTKSLVINGFDAELLILTGELDEINYGVSYLLTFVEGNEKVYMIMAWTLEESMGKYKPTFEKVVKSFHLLNG